MKRKIIVWLAGVAVAVLAAVPFWAATGFALFNCDDHSYMVWNREVFAGFGWDSVKFAFTYCDDAIWMPLTRMSYMIDFAIARWLGPDNWAAECGYWLHGDFAYHVAHAHSIVIHALNAVLVFLVLSRLRRLRSGREMGRVARAVVALAALLWAVHPLRCESVAWLASRKDVCSFFWMMVSLLCWLRYRESDKSKSRVEVEERNLSFCAYGGALIAFVVGALYKPSVMTLPGLYLVVDWLIVREGRLCGWLGRLVREKRWVSPELSLWGPYALPLGIAAVVFCEASWAQAHVGAMTQFPGMGLGYRAINAAAAFGMYVKNTVWPLDLAPMCVMKFPAMPRFWQQGIVISGIAAVMLWKAVWGRGRESKSEVEVEERNLSTCAPRIAPPSELASLGGYSLTSGETPLPRSAGQPERARCPFHEGTDLVLAGALWFCGALVPFMANFGYHAFADRFTYIPAVGVSLMAMGGISLVRGRALRCGAVGALAGVVLAFGALTVRQTAIWENDRTAWGHTLEVDGVDNIKAQMAVGHWYYEWPHDLTNAIQHIEAGRKADEDNRLGGADFIDVACYFELKRDDKVAEAMKVYAKRVREFEKLRTSGADYSADARGEGMANRIVSGVDLATKYRYDCARALNLATEESLVKAAYEELDELAVRHPAETTVMFTKGLIARRYGDKEREQESWRVIREKGQCVSAMCYRFVKRWEVEKVE